jgi:competence protein ComEA
MTKIGKVVLGLLCGLALAAGGPAGATPPAPGLAPGQRVDINTASADELARLPGIGPAKAQAIVEHRAHETFARVDDLRKVKGIGEKLFEQVREHLTVGDAGGAVGGKVGRGG